MAYSSGTAVDISAIRTALIAACTAAGWAWNSSTEVLSKGELFIRLQVATGELLALGRTAAGAGDAPGTVKIGRIFNRAGFPTYELTYPAVYEVFVFTDPDEVYLVVNYDVDRHQWLAFGQSSVLGLPGTGMWVGATLASETPWAGAVMNGPFALGAGYGGLDASSYRLTSGALSFGSVASTQGVATRNFWLNSNLDGQGWWLGQSLTAAPIGVRSVAPLLSLLPSSWNSESVLLPIRAYKTRPSSKVSLICDLENARYMRIDNYAAGEVFSLGAERWKALPWHQKNATLAGRSGGDGITHTGTLGWAIRYEGP